nr:MAG: polyprotein [Picornaviridae sp.]
MASTNPKTTPSSTASSSSGVEVIGQVEEAEEATSRSTANTTPYVSRLVQMLFPRAETTAATVDNTARQIEDMLPALNRALDAFEATTVDVSITSKAILGLTQSIREIVERVPTLVNFATKIVDGVVWLYEIVLAWIQRNLAALPSLIYRFLSLIDISPKLIAIALDHITAQLAPIEPQQGPIRAQAQADNGLPLDFNLLSSITTFLTGVAVLHDIPKEKDVRAINDVMRAKNMISTEVSSTLSAFAALLRRIPEELQLWLQHAMPMRLWCDLFAPGSMYFTWIDEVEELHLAANRQRLTFDVALQTRVRNAYRTGKQLLERLALATRPNTALSALLSRVFARMQELYDIVDVSGSTTGMRPVPYVIYLSGAPGVGKSFLMTVLPPFLAGADAETANLSWARNPGIPHWDGYTGQFAVTYDDFAAIRGANLQPGEAAELINIVSNDQYRLPMAALPEKGEVFRSRLVVISSNAAYPHPNEIAHQDALLRRRNVLVNVSVAPGFNIPGTTLLDPARVTPDNRQWVFQLMNPLAPGNVGNPMDYTQFMDFLRADYDAHFEQQLRALTNQRTMLATALDQREQRLRRRDEEQFHDAVEAEAQGLMDDFQAWANRVQERTATANTLSTELRVLLDRLARAEEARASSRLRTLLSLLPWIGLACAAVGTAFALRALCQKKKPHKMETQGAYSGVRTMARPPIRIMRQNGEYIDPTEETLTQVVRDAFGELLPEADIQRVVRESLIKLERKAQIADKIRSSGGPVERLHPQSDDSNAREVITFKVLPNMVKVQLGTNVINGLFIKGRLLMVPRHLFYTTTGEMHQKGAPLRILSGSTIFEMKYDPAKRVTMGEDTAFYLCDVQVRQFKDISAHFIMDADLSFKAHFDGVLLYLNKMAIPEMATVQVARNSTPMLYTTGNEEFLYEAFQLWEYNHNPGIGACGGPLVACGVAHVRKLCGFHVAGTNSRGYAHVVTREMIDEALEKLRPIGNGIPIPKEVITEEGVQEVMRITPQGNFTYVGVLEKPIYIPTATKLMPSVLYDRVYKHTTEPAVLHPKDVRLTVPVKPLELGVSKYGNVAQPLNEDHIARIVAHMSAQLSEFKSELPRSIIPEDVAICGDPMIEYADPINMDTSPGYPYNQWNLGPGKYALFDFRSQPIKILDDRLRKAVDLRWELLKRGLRVPSLWIDTLKDERRKLEKVRAGKTRVFTIPPVDFTICARRLFQSFIVMLYKNRIRTFSAVGISPESGEWTQLWNRLNEVSDTGFAGDYSSFDGNLSPQIMMAACDIINNWYADDFEAQVMRHTIFDEIIHTLQVGINSVYLTHLGNPSGTPFTATLNTMVNAIYLRYAWLELAPIEMRSLVFFDKYVRDQEYGDDILCAVHPDVQSWFTPQAISEVLASIGMTFTNVSKDGKQLGFQPLSELTFLKRGFAKGPFGERLPTMDPDVIHELVNWIRRSDVNTPEEAFLENVNESLRFAFFHGREFFDEHRKKVVTALDGGRGACLHDYAFFHSWFYTDYLIGPGADATTFIKLSEMKLKEEKKQLKKGTLAAETIFLRGLSPWWAARSESPQRLEAQSDTSGGHFENTQGVVSITQRAHQEEKALDDSMQSGKQRATLAVMERPWTLPAMAQRRTLIKTGAWATDKAIGTHLEVLQIPTDVLVLPFQSAPFRNFLYWSGTVRIIVQVNGTRFHVGQLMLGVMPVMSKAQFNAEYAGPSRLNATSGLQHQFISASTSNEAAVNVPFVNPKSKLVLNTNMGASPEYTGVVFLQVVVPLAAGTGTAGNINYAVFVEFNADQQFSVPLLAGKKNYAYNRRDEAYMRRTVVRAQAQGNTLTSNSIFNNYGKMNDANLPTNLTGDAIGNDAKVSGLPMDYPSYTANPIPVYRQPMQRLCNTVGVDAVTRLDLNGGTQNTCDPETFGVGADEMTMEFLLQTPNICQIVQWKNSDVAGARLASGLLGPMAFAYDANGAVPAWTDYTEISDVVTKKLHTQWDYTSKGFRFWRGGIKIRLDVVASQMHTGRLLLSSNYGALPRDESTIVDAASQFCAIIDLNDQEHTFVFEIPYKAATPWLMVASGELFQTAAEETLSHEAMRHFFGSWNLQVLNELVAPDASPPVVSIVISMAGARDYEVYYPTANNNMLMPMIGIMPTIAQAQSDTNGGGDAGGDSVPMPSLHQTDGKTAGTVIAPTPVLARTPISHFGIKSRVSHLGDILKRYEPDPVFVQKDVFFPLNIARENILIDGTPYLYKMDGNTQAMIIRVIEVMPTKPTEVMVANRLRGMKGAATPLSAFSPMYRLWRGSLRYKVMLGEIRCKQAYPTPPITMKRSHTVAMFLPVAGNICSVNPYTIDQIIVPTATRRGAVDYGGSPLAVAYADGNAPYLELEIPCTTIYNSLLTNHVDGQTQTPVDLMGVGQLVIAETIYWSEGMKMDDMQEDITIFKAAGDDFRYGAFSGVPRLMFKTPGFAVFPDSWKTYVPPPGGIAGAARALGAEVAAGTESAAQEAILRGLYDAFIAVPSNAQASVSAAAWETFAKKASEFRIDAAEYHKNRQAEEAAKVAGATAAAAVARAAKPRPRKPRAVPSRSSSSDSYERLEPQMAQVEPTLFEFGRATFQLPATLFTSAMTRTVEQRSNAEHAQRNLVTVMAYANVGMPLFRAFPKLKEKLQLHVYIGPVRDYGEKKRYWREYYWSCWIGSGGTRVRLRNWSPATSLVQCDDPVAIEDQCKEAIIIELALALRALVLNEYRDLPPFFAFDNPVPTLEDEIRAMRVAAAGVADTPVAVAHEALEEDTKVPIRAQAQSMVDAPPLRSRHTSASAIREDAPTLIHNILAVLENADVSAPGSAKCRVYDLMALHPNEFSCSLIHLEREGPDHALEFAVTLRTGITHEGTTHTFESHGMGTTKKSAQDRAYKEVIEATVEYARHVLKEMDERDKQTKQADAEAAAAGATAPKPRPFPRTMDEVEAAMDSGDIDGADALELLLSDNSPIKEFDFRAELRDKPLYYGTQAEVTLTAPGHDTIQRSVLLPNAEQAKQVAALCALGQVALKHRAMRLDKQKRVKKHAVMFVVDAEKLNKMTSVDRLFYSINLLGSYSWPNTNVTDEQARDAVVWLQNFLKLDPGHPLGSSIQFALNGYEMSKERHRQNANRMAASTGEVSRETKFDEVD